MSQGALNPDQFHYQFKPATPKDMDPNPLHELHVFGGTANWHGSVGRMAWHHKTGEILNIEAYEPWRRQGVATSLLGEARRIAGETRGVRPPRHSADRTDLGEKWARSTGDRLPKRKQP
jgi:ribosomal protein S18 acetylase RimI-like enzyme